MKKAVSAILAGVLLLGFSSSSYAATTESTSPSIQTITQDGVTTTYETVIDNSDVTKVTFTASNGETGFVKYDKTEKEMTMESNGTVTTVPVNGGVYPEPPNGELPKPGDPQYPPGGHPYSLSEDLITDVGYYKYVHENDNIANYWWIETNPNNRIYLYESSDTKEDLDKFQAGVEQMEDLVADMTTGWTITSIDGFIACLAAATATLFGAALLAAGFLFGGIAWNYGHDIYHLNQKMGEYYNNVERYVD